MRAFCCVQGNIVVKDPTAEFELSRGVSDVNHARSLNGVVPSVAGLCKGETTMVSLAISAGGRAPLARELPITLTFDKSVGDVTVADVKSAIAAKFPRVSIHTHTLVASLMPFAVLSCTAKAFSQRGEEGTRGREHIAGSGRQGW